METSIPSTPPGNLEVHYQLPTPSSTAGSQKRIPCWLEDVAQQKRKRLQQFKDTEKDALSGYDEIQDNETYGITVSEASDTSSVSPLSIRCPAISDFSASISWGSHTGLSPQFFNRHGNFPFMSLPPNVRNRIYRLLLVVPAIICVRQKHTGYRTDKTPYIYTEPREFLPGIAYALGQFAVDGSKFRVCRFGTINTHILSVSKKIHAETKVILYGANSFEITAPCFEMNPAPNYTIPLFPRDCQYLVRNLVIRVRAFYPLQWIANGGYAELKCAYRSLDSLHIIFELDSMAKGLGRRLARKEEELWVPYVRRIHAAMKVELFDQDSSSKTIPIWLNLRVLFSGEPFEEMSKPSPYDRMIYSGRGDMSPTDEAEERLKRYHLKCGLAEAFELFKGGT